MAVEKSITVGTGELESNFKNQVPQFHEISG